MGISQEVNTPCLGGVAPEKFRILNRLWHRNLPEKLPGGFERRQRLGRIKRMCAITFADFFPIAIPYERDVRILQCWIVKPALKVHLPGC